MTPQDYKVLMDEQKIHLVIRRLSYEIIEHCQDIARLKLIGIQPRGTLFATLIQQELSTLLHIQIPLGTLDITFFRDDLQSRFHLPYPTQIPFSIQDQEIVLIDDVLYTGRTVRAAMDALNTFGRPLRIWLCVLIDRIRNRELPISPHFTGKKVDTIAEDYVKVCLDQKPMEVRLFQATK
jgi:pyrimidine operon attenuation protein/uracil phosphoribosyltransferase